MMSEQTNPPDLRPPNHFDEHFEEGEEAARTRANRAAERALALLLEVPADTTVLAEIVNGLAVRTV